MDSHNPLNRKVAALPFLMQLLSGFFYIDLIGLIAGVYYIIFRL
jgi:hypothetical protein